MKFLNKMNQLVLFCILMLTVHAFAQPAEVKEPILREYCYSCNVYDVMPYTPSGFTVEAAYAGPTVLSLQLWGYRNFYIKHKVLVGVPWVAADIDFDGGKVSDEGILAAILFFSSFEHNGNFLIWLDYLLFGNTYYPLTGDDGIGLFETHHIVDYLIYDLSNDKPWEFGFSEAAGFRFVYARGRRDGTYYFDLGANVRLTNKAFRFGIFVQLGATGNHT
ncbi:MAG: hypothetical protein IIT53_16410 [Fibrobacter sp.]|nr:hypothetical protein [Fibrobacter sp.]